MVLQHSSVTHITMILFNAKVGIFPPSYAVIPSFISCFTTFYHLDSYFIFKLIIFNMLVCLVIDNIYLYIIYGLVW